ncbi:MAG: TetR/AcrR family transcriptional regulator [Candidatus Sericytochromatia bacterium]
MRVSKEKMAENRQLIVAAASHLFREKGIEAVSVAEIMQAVGLTHGGFYGHFQSKDELVAAALAYALSETQRKKWDASTFVADYLSAEHRDGLAEACPTAGFVATICQQSPPARQVLTEGIRTQIDGISQMLAPDNPPAQRQQAIGYLSALVGALLLSRSVDDARFSDEILEQTRYWLEEHTHPDGAASGAQ